MPRLGTYLLVSINIYVDKMMHWELVADRTLRNKDVYFVLSNDTTVPLSHSKCAGHGAWTVWWITESWFIMLQSQYITEVALADIDLSNQPEELQNTQLSIWSFKLTPRCHI